MGYDFFAALSRGEIAEPAGEMRGLWAAALPQYPVDDPGGNEAALEAFKKEQRRLHHHLVEEHALSRVFASHGELLDALDLRRPTLDVVSLPALSFSISLQFTLAKAYLSRDDEVWYPCENPVRKEKVFKLPMVGSGSWKGNLRSALRPARGWCDQEETMQRLFGNPRGEEDAFRSGRLLFYPTYFEAVDWEVINPHDRVKKAGTRPIHIECVPAGQSGAFDILYVPLPARVAADGLTDEACVADDLVAVCLGLGQMMLTYGFSAKRSDGYGTAEPVVREGRLVINYTPAPANAPAKPWWWEPGWGETLPKYLQSDGRLQSTYLGPEGEMRRFSPAELAGLKKTAQQQHEKASKFVARIKSRCSDWRPEDAVPAPDRQEAPPSPVVREPLSRSFVSFEGLLDAAHQVAASLGGGEG